MQQPKPDAPTVNELLAKRRQARALGQQLPGEAPARAGGEA